MGFYFRKSINFGLFRLNFSKSGIGVSFGTTGARFSIGPKGGRANIGRNGMYYRKDVSKNKLKKLIGKK